MSLSVRFSKVYNHLLDEDIIVPRLVNQQSLDFDKLCEYLADGSTLTAGDIAAVMKLIETRLPFILALNAKVVCSSEGLTFRPTVSGSITQSQLRARLEERKANETDPKKAKEIDVNRALATSDLSVSDLTAGIAIDLPNRWYERFRSKADFKRVTSANSDATETTDDGGTDDTGINTGGGTGNPDGGSDSGDSIG